MRDIEKSIISEYSRSLMHMREQIQLKRFGLVFGAGIGIDFGFPSWSNLINEIANDQRVDGTRIFDKDKNKTSITQVLFQNYCSKAHEADPSNLDAYDKLSSTIHAGWHRIIHDALYKNVPNQINELQQKDKYLSKYLSLIRKTRLTVNYNFDDTLQTLLSNDDTARLEPNKRGYRTVWNANIQLYPQDGVIYHPNGFLPRDFRERPSDHLIFLEDSFGDQLMDSVAGHYAALSYHFSQNTCLFLGLSLEDATLKHLLRKNAKLHPGHVHYYIYFVSDKNSLNDEYVKAIRDSNFEVYNLITLFLGAEEIACLGELLSQENSDIDFLLDELGVSPAYRFFVTGSVSVGKSTTVSNFRSLITHDEWLEKKLPGMEKDPSLLNSQDIKPIDSWVANQWRIKNFALQSSTTRGLHIIDRCPLDALAFTPEKEWTQKASFTLGTITPAQSTTKLCNGKIILLTGDPDVIAIRATKLQKKVTPEKLEYRQNLLKVIYDSKVPGIVEVDTRGKSIERVVKEVCKIIHLHNYSECNLQERLESVASGILVPNENHND
jgi:hypothetical protein